MKYLGIHKLLWAILVAIYTLFEGILAIFVWVIYFIWNFKPPIRLWRELHHADKAIDNYWGGYAYWDDNIWYTIVRRYKYTWKSPGYCVTVVNGKPYGRDERWLPIM